MELDINPIEDMLAFEPQLVTQIQKTKVEEHICFSCGKPFPVGEHSDICPICHWTRCPECGNCACTLTPEAQMALRGVWLTFCQHCNNPCKRKGIGAKRSPTEIEEYIGRIENDPKLDSATKKRFIDHAKMKRRL